MSKGTRHPVTRPHDFENHAAMAAHWGGEARWHLGRALTVPPVPFIGTEDLQMENLYRAARMAGWHALKVLGRKEARDD